VNCGEVCGVVYEVWYGVYDLQGCEVCEVYSVSDVCVYLWCVYLDTLGR